MNKLTVKQKKELIYKLLMAILVLVMLSSAYVLFTSFKGDNDANNETKRVYNIVEQTSDENKEFTKESYKALNEVNSDFIAYIKFDSGIIEQPIMQTTDNDYYLKHTIERNWYDSGAIFMDYQSKLDDTNIVIYGHNNSYNHDIMFSRLNDMITSQDYYEENSRFKIYLEDEVREYVICYMYYITEDEYQSYDFLKANFDARGEFLDWMKIGKEKSTINSIYGDIDYGNNFVTLQTCKRLNQDVKVVAVAKEVLVKKY